MWWWTALALAGAPTWTDTVVAGLGQDGVWLTAEELGDRLARHCADGVDAACRWGRAREQVDRPDVEGVAELLAGSCGNDDPVACLPGGWNLGQAEHGVYTPKAIEDPDAAMAVLTSICDQGMRRGCVEVARAKLAGLGTYASDEQAASSFAELCRRGEARACRELGLLGGDDGSAYLDRALSLGDEAVREILAARMSHAAPERSELLEEACEAGVRDACTARAATETDRGEQERWLRRGCALHDDTACARRELVRDATTADRLAELRRVGRRWPEAAAWAALMAQGAQLPAFSGTSLDDPLLRDGLLRDVRAALQGCYQEQLAGTDASGWADAVVLVGKAGAVEGMALEGSWVSPEMQSCAFEAAREVQSLPAQSHAIVVSGRLGFDHASVATSVKPSDARDSGRDFNAAAPVVREWVDELEACVVGSGYVVPAARLAVKVHRRGYPASVEVTEGSGVAAIDACLGSTLMQRSADLQLVGHLRLNVEVALMRAAEPEPEPGVRYRDEPWPLDGPTAEERVLVLVLTSHEADGKGASLGARSVASIEAAHQAAYDWVAEHSGGALQVSHEVRVVDAALLRPLGAGDGAHRWNVDIDDLPPEVVRSIEPGHYDTIYLWAPLPRGAPQPSLGVVWSDQLLRGAGFVSMGLPSGREFLLPEGVPPYVGVLAGHYMLWAGRARRLLGMELPPNNRVLRREGGIRHDPRIGLADDPTEFYQHVFANDFRPSFWRDLTTFADDHNAATPGNLAVTADAIGSDGVELVDYLNDAVVTYGDYWVAAFDPSDAASSWFGLSWEEPVQLGRLRAVLPREEGEGAPSVDVEAWQGDRWVHLQTVAEAPEALEVRLDPIETTGIRIVVTTAAERRCLELEAFAP